MTTRNEYGQPVGDLVPGWTPMQRPEAQRLEGRHCTLERLDADRHADELFAAYSSASDGRDWTYMPVGPFDSFADYRAWAEDAAASTDPLHFAVIAAGSGGAVGTLSLMRHDPANGVIEVGYVAFSPLLQRTPASTEAQYLLMRHVFDDLGYRRYEWKCDALNEPSRRAAARLGFTYEGTFRQAVVTKGRNRDTAWFSLLDGEWPHMRGAFEAWLDPSNFTPEGHQLSALQTARGLPRAEEAIR